MSDQTARDAFLLDILLTSVLVVLGVATWIVARPIPDNAFEPLGAGFAPRTIGICLAGLGVLNLAVRFIEPRSTEAVSLFRQTRLLDCVATLLITALYVWIVSVKLMPFWLSTGLFTALSMTLLFRNVRLIPVYAGIGLALGFAIKLASSTVFYVDI